MIALRLKFLKMAFKLSKSKLILFAVEKFNLNWIAFARDYIVLQMTNMVVKSVSLHSPRDDRDGKVHKVFLATVF
jgi:hypothetical protein